MQIINVEPILKIILTKALSKETQKYAAFELLYTFIQSQQTGNPRMFCIGTLE